MQRRCAAAVNIILFVAVVGGPHRPTLTVALADFAYRVQLVAALERRDDRGVRAPGGLHGLQADAAEYLQPLHVSKARKPW